MKTTLWLWRPVAAMLAILLAVPLAAIASAQETTPPKPPETRATLPPASPVPGSDARSPADASSEVASLPDSPAPQTDPGAQQQQQQPPPNPQQQTTPTQPMGTAAAPAEPAGGVAATRPAGAAIAPAKQKRSHTLLIRMSLLIGAAVAVGTVIGLSEASPNRP